MTTFDSLNVPSPIPNHITQPFWDATAKGRFDLQHCDDCDQWIFYPRSHCPNCWSSHLSWRTASGCGRLKSFSLVYRPGHPAWAPVAPYALGLVELNEGPTMLSMLTGASNDAWRVGMLLTVQLQRVGRYTLPMFRPAPTENEKT